MEIASELDTPLLPCPFCGGTADFDTDEFYSNIKCESCGASAERFYQDGDDRKNAILAWNARV